MMECDDRLAPASHSADAAEMEIYAQRMNLVLRNEW
jgi:hypothetical protein